jgi:hypothetical protein
MIGLHLVWGGMGYNVCGNGRVYWTGSCVGFFFGFVVRSGGLE